MAPFVLGACSYALSRVVRTWHCRTRKMCGGGTNYHQTALRGLVRAYLRGLIIAE
ncbi:hypothetical protein ABZ897_49925 [Nonomuraea sp. NPDC046802]|uniref:hypothetical protein n=1 Tax=Nonomuraea sp. NPDC046802 TaxID=3154919 RepID=UPI0033F57F63